jgi:hypothetical protein
LAETHASPSAQTSLRRRFAYSAVENKPASWRNWDQVGLKNSEMQFSGHKPADRFKHPIFAAGWERERDEADG